MDTSNYCSVSPYGRISVEFLGSESLPPPVGYPTGVKAAHYRYLWGPPRNLRREVYPGFSITLDCYATDDGVRRGVPSSGYELFIAQAYLAGLAILGHEQQLDGKQRNKYRAMWLIFNHVRRMQDHLDRQFSALRDLYIRLPGRDNRNVRNVLPGDVKVRSAKDLASLGRNVAETRGVADPETWQRIQFGLLEYAEKDPLLLEQKDVPILVRTALFAPPLGKRPTRRMMNTVMQRIVAAIEQHHDDTADEFDRWMSGPHSNFIKTIADQPRSPGGKLPAREDVRRALLELGWEAYNCLAECIEAFATWFQRGVPDEMTAMEQRHFAHMFMRRSYFGGLPLVMLMERRLFLGAAVTDVWSDPRSRQSVGVLHRMMCYYKEMVANRREADRRFKPKGASSRQQPTHILRLDADGAEIPSPSAPSSNLQEIIEQICEERGLQPYCVCGSFEAKLVATDPRPHEPIEFHCRCGCGRLDFSISVTRDTLKKTAHKLGIGGGKIPAD